MMKTHLFIIICLALLLSLDVYPQARGGGQAAKKYWVYFSDKGPSVPTSGKLQKLTSSYNIGLEYVSQRALTRRAKVLPSGELIDAGDLPLYQPYLEKIAEAGGILQQQVRWMNAASFLLTPEQVTSVTHLLFVTRVTPVVGFHGYIGVQESEQQFPSFAKTTTLNYGSSLTQVKTINAIPLHDMGITGSDVLIGMLDTGFRWKVHESLKTRRVIAEYDFIFHDSVTANETGDASNCPRLTTCQDAHGTLTMSTVGGYMPGKLIGPAFGASFILAKTEDIRSETPIEEDNWAAAIEWMENNGVDVVSSSLGYNDFDPHGPSPGDYTWANGDFDGRTSVTAKAAARAAKLGVCVCDAMGNENNGDGTMGTLLTPADADSIISVGAVDFSKQLAGFSSTGPTNDGRTKPDVVATGVDVYCASTASSSSYFFASGTSLATPMTSGSAALALSARPELTPIQVRDALRSTAEPITDVVLYPISPNNFTGWGLINAFNAALSFGPIFSNAPTVSIVNGMSAVTIDVVSKFGIMPDSVLLHYAVGSSNTFTALPMVIDSAMFFPTSGRFNATIPSQAFDTVIRFFIDAKDSSSNLYASPPPILGKLWQLNYGITGVKSIAHIPKTYALQQNYPNPFNPTTKITYDLPRREHVIIQVFTILGELVATLVDEIQDAGVASSRPPVTFDGSNLPSGVYLYRLTTPSFSATRKMMLIR